MFVSEDIACVFSYPRNMILLSLFTLAQGTSLGVLCAFTDATAILMATGLTGKWH